MQPKNPKRRAYRDITHPLHEFYLSHRRRMAGKKMANSTARATLRTYKVAGEAGANRYHANGDVAPSRIGGKMALMGLLAQALGGNLPKTGIQRQQ